MIKGQAADIPVLSYLLPGVGKWTINVVARSGKVE
jgi:hypothetical protein